MPHITFQTYIQNIRVSYWTVTEAFGRCTNLSKILRRIRKDNQKIETGNIKLKTKENKRNITK